MNYKGIELPLDTESLWNENGTVKSRALFVQTRSQHQGEEFDPLFSLQRDKVLEGKLYPSLKELYVQIGDITEYNFALEVFGDWETWHQIQASPILAPHIQKWREELEVKLRSEAINTLIKVSASPDAKSTTAAKYVAEKGWEKQYREKDPVQSRIQKKLSAEFEDDAARIGLKVIK